MLDKFAKEKQKQTIFFIGIIGVVMACVFLVTDIFSAKEKLDKVPDIKIMKEEEVEEQSFKVAYGKDLATVKKDIMALKNENSKLERENARLEKEKLDLKNKNVEFKTSKIDESQNNTSFMSTPPMPNNVNSVSGKNSNNKNFKADAPEHQAPVVLQNLIVFDGEPAPLKSVKDIQNEQAKKNKKPSKTVENTIPAGSFMQAVLLSGLDAPTGGKAASSPHPCLIKIEDMTQMPNEWKTDLREAFMIGHGYGDVSSERAYIRLEQFRAIKDDGTIISKKIEGYVSGEDGKIGLAGLVISKQGQILLRSLTAGFVQGVADAFKEQSTTYSIQPTGSVSTIDTDEVGKYALFSGGSEALSNLAEFYKKMIDDMFPVIEINAGRTIDIVFLKDVDLSEDD